MFSAWPAMVHVVITAAIAGDSTLHILCLRAVIWSSGQRMCNVCCSDLSEPSGSDAANDLIDEIEDDDDDEVIDLVDDGDPRTTGQSYKPFCGCIAFFTRSSWLTCNSLPISLNDSHADDKQDCPSVW